MIRGHQPEYAAYRCGLSGSIRPDKPEDSWPIHLDMQIIDRFLAPERFF
jgi:hypothetical protein